MSQPKWRTIGRCYGGVVEKDLTGVYASELVHRENKWRFRITLDRLSFSPTQLELFQLRPQMGHIPTLVDVIDAKGVEHRPWFEDQMHNSGRMDVHCVVAEHSAYCPTCGRWIMLHLSEAAACFDISADRLRQMFCSPRALVRGEAYSIVAGYHGWMNFDSYPVQV